MLTRELDWNSGKCWLNFLPAPLSTHIYIIFVDERLSFARWIKRRNINWEAFRQTAFGAWNWFFRTKYHATLRKALIKLVIQSDAWSPVSGEKLFLDVNPLCSLLSSPTESVSHDFPKHRRIGSWRNSLSSHTKVKTKVMHSVRLPTWAWIPWKLLGELRQNFHRSWNNAAESQPRYNSTQSFATACGINYQNFACGWETSHQRLKSEKSVGDKFWLCSCSWIVWAEEFFLEMGRSFVAENTQRLRAF